MTTTIASLLAATLAISLAQGQNFPQRACTADCNGDAELDFLDFLCFQDLFAGGDPGADCDGSGALDLFDFLCFQNAFAAGCPPLEIFDLGTEAPPPVVCGAPMTPFPEDPRPTFVDVTDVPSPLGGRLEFGAPVSHRRIGDGWGAWSHGYTGDVYYTDGESLLEISVPGNDAFYLYISPNAFTLEEFVITALGTGTELTLPPQLIHGTAPRGYGFCGRIEGVRVEVVTGHMFFDFAVGEFGIAD